MTSIRKAVLGDPARMRDLATIHVAKKQLGMEDDAYRAMLWSLARVSSAADLDHAGRKVVLEHMRKCGFKRTRTQGLDQQSKKIVAMWLALRDLGALKASTSRALDAYVERQTGAKSLRWLSSEQASKVIESLKAWQRRARRGMPEEGEEAHG